MDQPRIQRRVSQASSERQTLRRIAKRWAVPNDPLAYGLLALDLLGLIALSLASALAPLPVQILLAPLIALTMARLFFIGHDAGHLSYVSSTTANRVISLIAFLPSLTPAVTWNFGHAIHHNFANVIGLDTTWPPATPRAYAAMPPWRRWLERLWRRPLGQGLYMLYGNVGQNLAVPFRRDVNRAMRMKAGLNAALVALYTLGVSWGLVLLGGWGALLWAFVVPLVLWFSLGGAVLFLNHTEPDIAWHGVSDRSGRERTMSETALDETTVVTLPWGLHRVLHNVFEHVPHHLNPKIPCYHLRRARQEIERALPGRLVHLRLSWARYVQICRTCQLYDLESRRWVHFGYRSDAQQPLARPAPIAS